MTSVKKLLEALKKDVKNSGQKSNDTYLQLVKLFPLLPIRAKSHYQLSLKVLEKIISYINEEKLKDEGADMYLTTLNQLIREYERGQFENGPVTGAEMLAYLMELQGLTQTDLAKELGGQPVVSKILKGERELNLRQIKALAKRFKVSPEVFI